VRVLAFRHSPSDGLGLIGEVLDAHDISCECADLYDVGATEPSIADADALIFLGGSMSANDDLSFLQREIDYLRAAVPLGKPVLGVCLGAQLIAKALGARVYPNMTKEIGWASVTFTDAAQKDRLLNGLRSEVIFHWHGETFDLPAGAELLASSVACRNQAFRLSDRVYGFQFHLEVTPEMILDWCAEDAARAVNEPLDPYANAARAKDLARIVFGRWCELVKEHTEGRPRCSSA
jgi:GMP synthase-like glutamine amidotransferase